MHSYWLVILSTLLATPSRRLTLCGTFLAVPKPFNTHVSKIGLIDLDDLTKEDTKHTRGTLYHLLHHRRKGIAEVTK